MNVVTLCTGNVARSVMLGFMLTTIADASGSEWNIRTAGTHVAEGSAMSGRTRDALMKIEELGAHRYGAHRSHQLTEVDCEWADVILAAEAANVRFVRTAFASQSHKAVQLSMFDRYATSGGTFDEQLGTVLTHEPTVEFDIVDPAGGDQATYDACARELWNLAQTFSLIVRDEGAG